MVFTDPGLEHIVVAAGYADAGEIGGESRPIVRIGIDRGLRRGYEVVAVGFSTTARSDFDPI